MQTRTRRTRQGFPFLMPEIDFLIKKNELRFGQVTGKRHPSGEEDEEGGVSSILGGKVPESLDDPVPDGIGVSFPVFFIHNIASCI